MEKIIWNKKLTCEDVQEYINCCKKILIQQPLTVDKEIESTHRFIETFGPVDE